MFYNSTFHDWDVAYHKKSYDKILILPSIVPEGWTTADPSI